jgi:hypothetical protein
MDSDQRSLDQLAARIEQLEAAIARRKSKSKHWMWAGLALIFAVITSTAVYASVPDSNGVIHGCILSGSRFLRIIDTATSSCRPTETPISWSAGGNPASLQLSVSPTPVESSEALSLTVTVAGGQGGIVLFEITDPVSSSPLSTSCVPKPVA